MAEAENSGIIIRPQLLSATRRARGFPSTINDYAGAGCLIMRIGNFTLWVFTVWLDQYR